jgi:zinc/manganese transport system substrate-binding protein
MEVPMSMLMSLLARRQLLATAVALVGLMAGSRPACAVLRVVATVPDLAAVAREVGGDAVSVQAMSLPTQDPHFVDARPSLALQLNRADLVVLVGLELEVGWLPTLLVGARNPAIQTGARGYLDCSQFVHRLDVPSGPIDRSMGDIHPGGNPHYMIDPRAAAAVAEGMADRMAELDPAHAAGYHQNAAAFRQKLASDRKAWEAKMAPFRGRPFIEYHKTLVYLADWLGLKEFGSAEPKPGIPPNPSHVAQLLARARVNKVSAIIQEDKYPDAATRLLAQKIPATFIRIPGGTDFQHGQRYRDYIDQVIKRIAAGLGGTGS